MPEINYLWDELEDNVIEEFDETGDTIVAYTTEPVIYGTTLTQDRSGDLRHCHYDGLGNTIGVTNNAGTVVATRRYSAFGDVTLSTGLTTIDREWGGRWGYQHNPECHYSDIRRRSYSPLTQRWFSMDLINHIGLPSDLRSPYLYASNSPISKPDPSGEYEFATEVGDRCGPRAQACINLLLAQIKTILGQRADCFNDPSDRRDTRTCRGQITECLLQTLDSKLTIKCGNISNPAHEAESGGPCVWSKKRAYPTATVPPAGQNCRPDPSCNYCTNYHYGNWIRIDPDIALTDSSYCNRDKFGMAVIKAWVQTLLHELLHQCTGGHEEFKGKPPDLGRVDPGDLAKDFMRNCWTY